MSIRLCLYETKRDYPTKVEDITHAQAIAVMSTATTVQHGYHDEDDFVFSWCRNNYEYVRGIRVDGVPFEIRWKAELSDFQQEKKGDNDA